RHRRPAVPRVRGDAVRGDRRVAPGLADDHADDVLADPAPAPRTRGEPPWPARRPRVRRGRRRVPALARGGAAPRRDHEPRAARHRGAQRLALRRDPEGLLPAAGQRPDDRLDRGRPGVVVPVDAGEDEAVHRHRARRSAVENVVAFTGGGRRNGGFMFVTLKPLAERGVSADGVVSRLRVKTAGVAGASLFLFPAQDIRVGGRQSQSTYQYTLQSDDLTELRLWEPRIRYAFSQLPELADVNTDAQDKGVQTTLTVDRDAAARYGLTPSAIDTALNDAFGQRQVSTIYNPLNQYKVVMEVAPQYWQSPEALKDVYVINKSGDPVPLMAVAHFGPTNTPLS